MTDKSPKLLVDALGAIESAKDFVEGCTFADYAEDKMRRSAVERQLEILGEAWAMLSAYQRSNYT
jgi:uncharacterized protein with HEPN domain